MKKCSMEERKRKSVPCMALFPGDGHWNEVFPGSVPGGEEGKIKGFPWHCSLEASSRIKCSLEVFHGCEQWSKVFPEIVPEKISGEKFSLELRTGAGFF
jgi:hypothetical protein